MPWACRALGAGSRKFLSSIPFLTFFLEGCSLGIRPRRACWLLWEPQLNLKAKAGVASGLGNKALSFPGFLSLHFHFLP
jgi:hypothetical protein